jgi:hypothetical protein
MPQITRSRHAPPRAGAMVEALRGLGYSTATALADIVDNSISAAAVNIDIRFKWDGASSSISIRDDGVGMDDRELDLAMRLGERNPLDPRQTNDLGRFGLGLKTASFSQCRRLTVASRRHGAIGSLHWDLDVLAASEDDGWHLLEGYPEDVTRLLEPLQHQNHGTIVVWDKLDRIVTPGFTQQDFLDMVDRVERHLSMVFHRFLSGVRPRISLRINGREVKPWDPFMTAHAATWSSPIDHLDTESGRIEIQCHVLPHRDHLDTREQDLAAGPDGWTVQQGFYVYRNERLLVAGGWLGLGRGRAWTKEEAHRLARIRLDIPNTADADWKIDIRKSTARPPVAIRERLIRIAEDTRDRARRVFAHRGRAVSIRSNQELTYAWKPEHFRGGIRYRIDQAHPAVSAVLAEAGELETQVRAMLRVLEETIPVQQIWLDTAEARETPRTGFAEEPADEVQSVLAVMYRNLVLRKGMSAELARHQLLHTEPFNNYPELVAALPDVPEIQSRDGQ